MSERGRRTPEGAELRSDSSARLASSRRVARASVAIATIAVGSAIAVSSAIAEAQSPPVNRAAGEAASRPAGGVAADARPRRRSLASPELLRGSAATAEQRQRVAGFEASFQAAEAAARHAGLVLPDSVPLDTVRVGAVVVIADVAYAALARRVAERTSPLIDRAYGSAAEQLVSSPFLLRERTPTKADGNHTDTAMALTSMGGPRTSIGLEQRALERRLLLDAASAIRRSMDEPLRGWIGTYGSTALHDHVFTRAYEELVTSRSRVARGCLLGDADDCRSALLLVEPSDPVMEWYDPVHRRAIANERRWRLRPPAPAVYDACLGGDDGACATVLRALAPSEVPPPLTTSARHALVRVATAAGGRDAFARLMASADSTLDVRMSIAAGLPSDSLISTWRERVLAAQPRRAEIPLPTGVMALGWTLFFGLLATRSSRWR